MARRKLTEHSDNNNTEQQTLSADLLWGAEAIAEYLGRPTRQVFYLLERGAIDASKTGKFWTSTRSRLDRQFRGGPSAPEV